MVSTITCLSSRSQPHSFLADYLILFFLFSILSSLSFSFWLPSNTSTLLLLFLSSPLSSPSSSTTSPTAIRKRPIRKTPPELIALPSRHHDSASSSRRHSLCLVASSRLLLILSHRLPVQSTTLTVCFWQHTTSSLDAQAQAATTHIAIA